MRRRRRAFEGQEWAGHDVRWVVAIVLPLFLSVLYPAFLWVAVGTAALALTRIAVHLARRRRRERTNADAPFWADRIKE